MKKTKPIPILQLSSTDLKNLTRKILYLNLAGFEAIEAIAGAYEHKQDKDTKEYFFKKSKQLNLISCQIHGIMKDLINNMTDKEKILLQKYHTEIKKAHIKIDTNY